MPPRPWHRSYPAGVPHEAPLEDGLTLPAMVARSVARYPDTIAFECLGVGMSYRELDRWSLSFAAHLQRNGLAAGDHVALMLPNSLAYPVAALGVLRAGMVVVSVNPLYTARELVYQLRDSGAKAIVTSETILPMLREIQAETALRHVVHASAAELWPASATWQSEAGQPAQSGTAAFADALGQDAASPGFIEPTISANDIAFLQYTGGTTGVAKGAALTHASMIAAVVQQRIWQPSVYLPGDTICVTPLPLYHIYPLNVLLILLSIGGTNRLVPNPRELPQLVAEMKRAPFHILLGLNTLFNGLLASGQLDRSLFAAARIVHSAGAAGQQAVAERWKAATGMAFSESYGLTECSPGVTSNVLGATGWTGSIGVPVPSTDVLLIDAEGRPVPIGTPGELCVKGPQVFAGYWQRPEESRKVFTEDGWLRTGDIAAMDDSGRLYIVDRLKDMILVSGFNVYPNEIEAVVAMMPAVLECACIGVPDERSGEVPALFVVRREASLDAAQVAAHCRANLTGYKQPRQIHFVEALPKSPVGKILRRELRTPS